MCQPYPEELALYFTNKSFHPVPVSLFLSDTLSLSVAHIHIDYQNYLWLREPSLLQHYVTEIKDTVYIKPPVNCKCYNNYLVGQRLL